MSVRERRNRKDAKGKTPEQIRRGQRAYEISYQAIIDDLHEGDFPLSGAGYLLGIKTMLDHWVLPADDD